MYATGRQLSLTHHQYVVDRVFHERDTNVEVGNQLLHATDAAHYR